VRSDRIVRNAAALTVLALGAAAAVVSFRHARAVVLANGETGLTAVLIPLTVDGLVLVAGLVLLDCARRGEAPPALAKLALVLGIGATVAVNAAYGMAHGLVGAIVAGWPAVALVVSVELLMSMIRRGQVGEPRDVPALPAVPAPEVAAPTANPEPDEQQVQAAERFADDLAAGAVPSVRKIKSALRVGQPRAQEVRAYLSELATTGSAA
jgi:hypothetical protein